MVCFEGGSWLMTGRRPVGSAPRRLMISDDLDLISLRQIATQWATLQGFDKMPGESGSAEYMSGADLIYRRGNTHVARHVAVGVATLPRGGAKPLKKHECPNDVRAIGNGAWGGCARRGFHRPMFQTEWGVSAARRRGLGRTRNLSWILRNPYAGGAPPDCAFQKDGAIARTFGLIQGYCA